MTFPSYIIASRVGSTISLIIILIKLIKLTYFLFYFKAVLSHVSCRKNHLDCVTFIALFCIIYSWVFRIQSELLVEKSKIQYMSIEGKSVGKKVRVQKKFMLLKNIFNFRASVKPTASLLLHSASGKKKEEE